MSQWSDTFRRACRSEFGLKKCFTENNADAIQAVNRTGDHHQILNEYRTNTVLMQDHEEITVNQVVVIMNLSASTTVRSTQTCSLLIQICLRLC